MSRWRSCIYEGVVTHQRLRPRRHRLRYRIFQMLIDLDELPRLDRALSLFGYNRAGLLSFHDRDHGPGDGAPLRGHVERQLAAAGIDLDGGPIRLLCMPRVLGQAFNPLSVYFCHRPDGELVALIHEVNNTFGERHSYLIPVEPRSGRSVVQACEKQFYVSPFMDMRMSYDFNIRAPEQDVFVGIRTSDDEGPMLLATFAGDRRELWDVAMAGTLARHPLLALKVLAGIHWEALRTWLKGARFHHRPPAPANPVTVVRRPGLRRAA